MDTPSITTEEIALAVRGAISRSGETIDSVGSRAGIARTTMTRRMTGRSSFTAAELIRLAAELDIPLSDLLRDAEGIAARRKKVSA